MRVDLELANGKRTTIEVEGTQGFYDFQNGEGPYLQGWVQAMTGEWVRLSQVVSARAFDD